MELYKKILKARIEIKELLKKKEGENKYSNYFYFTPEQISNVTTIVGANNGILALFEFKIIENRYYGVLQVINTDVPSEIITLTQITDIPEIKATNFNQKIGGAVTYTKRYMLMDLYEISENHLDFDSQDNTKQPAETITKKELQIYLNSDNNEYSKSFINCYNAIHTKGKTINDLKEYYIITTKSEKLLTTKDLIK